MSNLPPPEPNLAAPTGIATQPANVPEPVKLSTKQAQEMLAKWNGNFQKCVNARTNFEKDWYYQMAFYFGRQWVEWIGNTVGDFMKLYEPPAPRWRVRLIINKIRPAVRKELTKLTKEKPQYYVLPRSTDEDDLAGARAAEQISDYLFDEVRFNFMRRRATFWTLLCGTAFLKDWFDPNAMDSSGIPGRVKLEAVDPFHVYVPDLAEEDLEAEPFVIHASAKSVSWVKETYDVDTTADVKSSGTPLEQKFFSALGVSKQPTDDLAFVKEAWIKPCHDYPDGAMLTWSSETILSFTPAWPVPYGEFPFSKIDHIPTGRFYGDSVIKDLIPIQKELNRTRSQLVEAKNRMAKPQLIAPKGSIDPNRITSEPGLIITYTPGFQPPAPIPLSQIPQYVIDEVTRCQQDMDDIAGQYEVSKGRTPPGVEAASAIAYLQEENDTRLYHTVASIEEAVEKTGRHLLVLADTYWDAQRLIRVTGKDRLFEANFFSKADIRGNTDFKIEAGSSAPRSRAAKQAFLTELGKLGWIPPDRILRYLDMADANRLYDEMQTSVRQAQRENLTMAQGGIQLPVNDYDDDQVHDNEHAQFMRSQEYEVLQPPIKQVLLLHLNSHRMRMAGGMAQGSAQSQSTPPGTEMQPAPEQPVPTNGNEQPTYQ